jgi:hypothetical protein
MAGNIAPKVVNDGLVMYLDAGNTNSYLGNGSTTWLNLKNNTTNAVLVNGPTFTTQNNGSILFDGINDVINLTITSDTFNNIYFKGLTAGQRSVTLEYFIYFNAINPAGLTGATYTDPTTAGWYMFSAGFVGYYLARRSDNGRLITMLKKPIAGINEWHTGTKSIELEKWTHIAFTMTENVMSKWYVDGVLDNTFTNSDYTFHPGFSNLFKIGQGYNNTTWAAGRISIFKIYNRALSAQEILQNYNTIKSRYS